MAVKATEITEKYVECQMNLFKTEEWREYTKPGNVPQWRCWLVALSGKGWWRLSATPQGHVAMGVSYGSMKLVPLHPVLF